MKIIKALGCALVTAVLMLAGTSPASAAEVTPNQLRYVGDSRQVMIVTSSSWTTSYATFQAWQKTSAGWVKPFGAMRARIGYNGFKLGKDRRQNSGTTPAGNYRIKKTFGQSSNPGTQMPYRNVDSNDYWSYDPADAKTYNLVQPYHRSTSTWRTSEAERLGAYPTQYKYAGIIAYNLPSGTVWNSVRGQWEASNPANTAKGGGIFLHVNGAGATAGCVSLYESSMLKVLKWMDPAKLPRIVMAPTSAITAV
jgi:L,D-peptidoglycan transpeptidase YkuD (ErfK/YbiS/YcfS/YnhG family)